MLTVKTQVRHKHTDPATNKHSEMARRLVEKIEEPGFLNDIWFSDEAHFLLHGQVNSRNRAYWDTIPPDEVRQKPLH